MELQHLVTRVPSPFNRLTVFDPRFPHGVREVRGTRDPRKGRLVLHGERRLLCLCVCVYTCVFLHRTQ